MARIDLTEATACAQDALDTFAAYKVALAALKVMWHAMRAQMEAELGDDLAEDYESIGQLDRTLKALPNLVGDLTDSHGTVQS